LEYLSEIYKKKKATEAYEKTLRDGFTRYPDSKFFFTYLIDYYNEAQQPDSAMSVVNSALAHDSENELYLFAKSNLLLNTGDYTGCIALCDSLIARNDQYADAYYNAGLAYINMALITKRDMKEGRQSRRLVNDFYKKSMPYMERYRELAPEEKDKWAAALYNIYLQLNMGKKFVEIDKLLR
jgi:predicted Zn-dependent protease